MKNFLSPPLLINKAKQNHPVFPGKRGDISAAREGRAVPTGTAHANPVAKSLSAFCLEAGEAKSNGLSSDYFL